VNPITAAGAEAQRLGLSIAGPALVVLAILRREDCTASRILRDLGLDAAQIETQLATVADKLDGAESTITFPPIVYRLAGRTEAFAATLGDGRITPEHTLLALMWDDNRELPSIDDRDIRPDILERLVAAGHPVPHSQPPAQSTAWTQRVVLDDANDAAACMQHLLRLDLEGWGWNVNQHGTRWFVASHDIDLLAIIEQAIGPGRARDVGLSTPDRDLV
jgi:ATP-dependent Clp protease ATP-binding subunit ClpA